MTKGRQTNSTPVSGQYSEQGQQTDLNTVSSQYSERDQQTELSSSDAEILSSSDSVILTQLAMSEHYRREVSKNFNLLESEYLKLLKKQRTNILPGLIGNAAGGAVGAIAGSAIYHAISANWSTIAPALASVAEAIVAAAPVTGIVVGSIAAVGIALFCVYEIYKHREKIKEGAKYIGEKTIEKAKALGKGVKKGYEHSTDSLKRGTSRALDRSGSFLKGAAHSGEYSMESGFVQRMLESQEIKDVVNDTIKAVKANDSCVLKTIQDKIKSLIGSKAEELKSKNVVDTTGQNRNLEVESKLRKQSRVVDRLGIILTQNMPDLKDLELVTQIFSEHKGEIEVILKDYQQNPENYPKPTTLSRKVSESMSSSFSSLRRKSSNESEASSSIANSTASSQAELLDSDKHKKVESTPLFSLFKAKLPSWLGGKGTSASYDVAEYEKLSRSNSFGESTNSIEFTSDDSGIGSPSADSDDGYTQINRSGKSSTTIKVNPPVVPGSMKPPRTSKHDSGDSGRGSPSTDFIVQTEAEVHAQPSINRIDP